MSCTKCGVGVKIFEMFVGKECLSFFMVFPSNILFFSGIIEEQERRLRKQQEDRVQREQQRIAEMSNVESEKQKMFEKIENMKLESEVGLKENVRQLRNRVRTVNILDPRFTQRGL